MVFHDEHDVDGRFGVTLDDFEPGPLPLRAVINRGRAMLIRRRIAAAAAAAAVVGTTSMLALQVGSEPMALAVMRAQHVRPDAYLIGSGQADGAPWAAKLYVGPRGSCFTLDGSRDCVPEDPASLARGRVEQVMVVTTSQLGPTGTPVHLIMMAAVPSVRYLTIRHADGVVSSVHVAEARGAGFAVIISPQNGNGKAVSWVAYSATGSALGWGQVNWRA